MQTQMPSPDLQFARRLAWSDVDPSLVSGPREMALLDVTTALSDAESGVDIAGVVVRQGLDMLDATSGLVAVLEGDKLRVLGLRNSVAATADVPSVLSLAGDEPLSDALRRREPVWLESNEHFQALYPRARDRILSGPASMAVLVLPLVHGPDLVGALVLGFDSSSAFGATNRIYALLLAQSVGAALARAGAFEREHDGRLGAEAMARAREEVLGVVAHDLRNPLGAIGGTIELLRDLNLDAPTRDKLLASATRGVHHMTRLVSDLLDVTRYENGRLSVETRELDVASLLVDAVDNIRREAEERGITLTVLPVAAGLRVLGDRSRLAQVFSNLLGNATKFTPAGGRVTVRSRRDGSEVLFEIEDTGPGVSPADRARLFDRFWQARVADLRGVGLGLPITKAIVEAHGGRVWVESELGVGSRFYFSLRPAPGSDDVQPPAAVLAGDVDRPVAGNPS